MVTFKSGKKRTSLSLLEKSEIKQKLLTGINFRSSTIGFSYAFAFIIFGFYSFEYLKKVIPNLTLWQNIWPRIVFNALPFLLLSFWSRSTIKTERIKQIIWIIAIPTLTNIASKIYFWPLFRSGHSELFWAVHTSNIFVFSFWFIFAGPTIEYAILMTISSLLIFWYPLYNILASFHDPYLLHVFLNDTAMSTILNFSSALSTSNLRFKLAREDVQSKANAKRFLGKRVTDAIFEHREDLLQNRFEYGFVVVLDLRGYTTFMNEVDRQTATHFMEVYHNKVNATVGDYGGFIHKTAGDGHLISFGLMDEKADLSEIPGIEKELEEANWNRGRYFVNKVVKTVDEIVASLENLKVEHPYSQKLRVGAAIDYGEIEIKLIGDNVYRQELDIFGACIIRCTRLESHTKVLMQKEGFNGSLLLITNEVFKFLENTNGFEKISTLTNPIRDFENLQNIHCKHYPIKSIRRKVA